MPQIDANTPEFARDTADLRSRQLQAEKNPAQAYYVFCCLMDGLNKAGQPTRQSFFDDGPFEQGTKFKGAVGDGTNWQTCPPSGRRQHTLKMLRKTDDRGFAVWAAWPLDPDGKPARVVIDRDGVPHLDLPANFKPAKVPGPWEKEMSRHVDVALVDDAWLARCVVHGGIRDEVARQAIARNVAKVEAEREQKRKDNEGVASAAASAAAIAVAGVMKDAGLLDRRNESKGKGT